MNEKEQLEQFVGETEKMLNLQQKYYKTPRDAPEKMGVLQASKKQESKVRQMIKDYREAEKRKLEPSLFD